MKPPFVRFAFFGVLLALPVLGCGTTESVQVCPGTAILAETASQTVMRPGAPRDPSGELYTVRLTGAKTDCVQEDDTKDTISTLDLTFHANRAPSAEGATYTVSYLVAATQGARVLSKKVYTIGFSFAPGAQTADFTAHVDDVRIHPETGTYGGSYQVTAGLQISDEDRAYNRKMGRYVP